MPASEAGILRCENLCGAGHKTRAASGLEQRGFAVEAGAGTEFFLNAEELVVFGDAVGARGGTRFDLARGGSDGKVGDEGVLGFAGAVRNDGFVTGLAGQF